MEHEVWYLFNDLSVRLVFSPLPHHSHLSLVHSLVALVVCKSLSIRLQAVVISEKTSFVLLSWMISVTKELDEVSETISDPNKLLVVVHV